MKFEDMLLGIAIGDAFGAGIEFQDRRWILENVDFTGYVNRRVGKYALGYKLGDWTDDTEMTIGVMEAMLDPPVTSKSMIDHWWAEYNLSKDDGGGVPRAGHGSISGYFEGIVALDEVRDLQMNREHPGNAPPMRAIPIGFAGDDLKRIAAINAMATHPHGEAVAASIGVAMMSEHMLVKGGDKQDLFDVVMEGIEDIDTPTYDYLAEVKSLKDFDLETLCGPQPLYQGIQGMPGYSMHTLGGALWVLSRHDDPFDCLKESIRFGGDVDSLASITVGIAAGRNGLDTLPRFLLDGLEKPDYLIQVAHTFDVWHEAFYN